MGFDFTNIPDGEGAAVYVLHYPTFTDTQRFEELKKDVLSSSPSSQIVLLDVNGA